MSFIEKFQEVKGKISRRLVSRSVAQWKVHLQKNVGNLSMILFRGLLEKQKRKRTPKNKISSHLESVEGLGKIFPSD